MKKYVFGSRDVQIAYAVVANAERVEVDMEAAEKKDDENGVGRYPNLPAAEQRAFNAQFPESEDEKEYRQAYAARDRKTWMLKAEEDASFALVAMTSAKKPGKV